MNSRHRKLHMEQMEAREMMAGDVSASVVKGTLYLTETAGQTNRDNSVLISQIAPGKIRVAGNATTTDGTISKVNGQNFADFNVMGGLDIKFAGGSDLVVFDGTSIPTFTSANIDLAAPPATLGASQSLTRNDTVSKSDADSLMMWGANITGTLTVNTGADHDWVYLGDKVTVGTAIIHTGASHDEVEFAGAHILQCLDVQTFDTLAENDADVVYFHTDLDLVQPTRVDSNANIRMGGGDDSLFLTDPTVPDSNVWYRGLHVGDSLSVDMGAGNDTAYLRNLRVEHDFLLNMGAGADTVDMHQTQIDGEFGFAPAAGGNLSIQMFADAAENDADTVNMFKIGAGGNMSILMGGGNDSLTLTSVSSQSDMTLDAGAGDDNVQLNDVLALDNFFANLGDGNDLLNIVDLRALFGTAKLDGGAGTDRLTKSGAFPTSATQLAFEWINGVPQPGVVVLPVNTNATQLR